MLPDGRQLVSWGVSESANWVSTYGDRIPGQVLADRVASAMHTYTLYWSVRCAAAAGGARTSRSSPGLTRALAPPARPFGAAVLLAVADRGKPQLYCIEPSGEFNVRGLPLSHTLTARASGGRRSLAEQPRRARARARSACSARRWARGGSRPRRRSSA